MNKRLQIIMSHENISASKLANILGVQPSAISHIIAERNKPSYDFIIKLLASFPQYNIEWLLLGTGRMLKEDVVEPSSNSRERQKSVETVIKEDALNQIDDDTIQSVDFPINSQDRNFCANKTVVTNHTAQSNSEHELNLDDSELLHMGDNMKNQTENVSTHSRNNYLNTPQNANNIESELALEVNNDKCKGSSGIQTDKDHDDNDKAERNCRMSGGNLMNVMLIYEDKTFELYNPRNI